MIEAQTVKPLSHNIVECINQTNIDCQGRENAFPYRYFSFGAEINHTETVVASGWPLINFASNVEHNKPKAVGLPIEGTRVTEDYFIKTLEKEATLLECGSTTGCSSIALPQEWLVDKQNSTSTANEQTINLSSISTSLVRLMTNAREEEFEDGMSSEFSRNLTRLIKLGGNAVVSVLADYLQGANIGIRLNEEIGAEALRWVGRIRDPETYDSRRWLLERSLFSKIPRIRDGAVLGLSTMNDPHAIRYLQIAVYREEIEVLREDLELVLFDLLGQ